MHIYTYTHIHIYTYTHIHTYTHTHIHTYLVSARILLISTTGSLESFTLDTSSSCRCVSCVMASGRRV
jgi:hypothetical protein